MSQASLVTPVHLALLSVGWLLGESVYVVAADPGISWAAVPAGIGAGVPWALLLSAVLALTSLAWARWLRVDSGTTALREAVTRLVRPASDALAAETSARLVVYLLLAATWLGAGFLASAVIERTLADPTFQKVAWLLTLLVLGVILVVVFPFVAWPVRTLVGLVLRIPWVGGAARPAGVLAFLMTVLSVALVLFLVLLPDLARALPWALVIGPACGLLLSFLLAPVLARSARRARFTLLGVAGPLAALAVFALLLPRALGEHRGVFLGGGSVTRLAMAGLSPLLDFDRDGSTGLYGGGDCAQFDPARSPVALEIANNGIDENCSGTDLEFEEGAFATGKTSHALPLAAPKRPHLVLLTTDALSYPHTNLAAYPRTVTPNLASWAKRATVFERGFSVSPSTRFAFPVLMAGVFNSQIKLSDAARIPYPWDPSTLTLAEIVGAKGYRTVAIPGDSYFTPARWGGFTQGFETVELEPARQGAGYRHTAAEVTALAIDHVRRATDPEKPLFLWVHYFDHHPPYSVPPGQPSLGAGQVDRYDAELTFADRHWGRLLEAIESTWKPEEYVAAFTADHGEAFDKNHPVEHHNSSVHTAVLHVPFVIQSAARRGERLTDLVSHADIVPTLANLVGHAPRKEWIGESLVPVLFDGRKAEKSVVYALTYLDEAGRHGIDPFFMIGLRNATHYYYENRRKDERRFVRWLDDPLDASDLLSVEPKAAETFQYLTAKKVQELRKSAQSLTRFYKAGPAAPPTTPIPKKPRKKPR